jgi:hypothetical protein
MTRRERLAELVDNYNHHADTARTYRYKADESERTAGMYADAMDKMQPTDDEAEALGWIK